MRNHILSCLAIILSFSAVAARAVPVDMSIEAEGKITSAYVWRGQVISENPCLQPSVTLGAGNFDLNIWGTLDLVDDEDTWERNRVDVTGSYAWERGRQVVDAGIVGYVYHDGPRQTSKDTFEMFVSYGVDVPLLPSLSIYYDFDRIDGYYGSFSLQHSIEIIPDRVAFDLGVFLGAADANYLNATIDDRSEAEDEIQDPLFIEALPLDLTTTFWIPIYIKPQLVVMPGAKYMTLLDSQVRKAVDDGGGETYKLTYSLSLVAYF